MRALRLMVTLVVGHAAAYAQGGEPTATVKVGPCPTVTLVDLEAKPDRTAYEAAEHIAKAMGYGSLVDKGALAGKTYGAAFSQKPAWECLVCVLESASATIGGNDQGDDYALTLYPAQKAFRYAVRGAFVARFAQSAPGTKGDHPVRHRPVSLPLLSEPRVVCGFEEAVVGGQKNAAGADCDLIKLALHSGRPQLEESVDGWSPWPGLMAYAVKCRVSYVTKVAGAEFTGLAIGAKPLVARHGAAELVTLEAVSESDRFVDLRVSFPSAVELESVGQGGWGTPVERDLQSQLGIVAELVDAAGKRVQPTVLAIEGDGKRLRLELRYVPHALARAGGLGAVRFRIAMPLERSTEALEFEMVDLLPPR